MGDDSKRKGRGGQPRKRTSGDGGGSSGRGRSSGGAGRGRKGAGRAEADDPAARLAGPLERVLKRLPATQREVLEWRMGLKDGHPRNLTDTAREMGLSMSEAKDIEKRAFEHIREAVPVEHLQKYLQG